MKKSLRSLCAVTTISLCAMGNLFAVDNNYFNSVYMIDQKQSLVQEWDKVFPQSDKVHHMKVTFRNRYGIILAADMYIPRNAEGKLPAIAVSGPFGAGTGVGVICTGLGGAWFSDDCLRSFVYRRK